MTKERGELLHGTLEMLIMQTLTEGAQHGFAITRHIRSASPDLLTVNEGSMYPALYRMQKRGWIDAEWGHSEKGKRAKYYKLTSSGRRELRAASQRWMRFTDAVAKLMEPQTGGAE